MASVEISVASGPVATREHPFVSVVVPARNCAAALRSCIESLAASTFSDRELIVVDDASTDATAQVAVSMGATVVRLPRCAGPAAARNRGAEEAKGEILCFVDSDVCVHPDTLERVVEAFRRDPLADAVFGSYDSRPRERNFLSQYRNLLHHFVHQDAKDEATTFWSGCGAVRRELFLDLGGFDPAYRRPSIEDIELGARLTKAGGRVVLAKNIQVTHLKRWTLWNMLVTDVRDRALPWTEFILRERSIPDDLNLAVRHRVSTVLAFGLLASLGIGARSFVGLLLVPLVALASVLVVDYWPARRRVPAALLGVAVAVPLGISAAVSLYSWPWGAVALLFLAGILLANLRLYAFFFRERHPAFAALVVPIHVVFYVYSGAAFVLGVAIHLWRRLFRRSAAAA